MFALSTGLVNSTFLGGGGEEVAVDMAIDSVNDLYLTGLTSSADFPTTPGAFDPVADGGVCDAGPGSHTCFDAFATKLRITPLVTSATLLPGSSLTLTANDPAQSTTLHFPVGSVTDTTVVTLAYQLSIPPLPLVGIDHTFSLSALQAGQPLTVFEQPFTMTVRYTAQEISHTTESSLKFYRLSPNVWQTTDISTTAQANLVITGTTTQPGVLAVLGDAKQTYFPIILKP